MTFLAHGIGGVRDLPVPASFFYTTAAFVLVASFVLLVALWPRPLLERHAYGAPLLRGLQAVLLARVLRIVLGAVSVGLLVLTLATALFGTTIEIVNFAPTFVYVIFWLGLPLLSVVLGDFWRVLSPWRAIADFTVWAIEATGSRARPLLDYPERLGRYPAAGALFAFVALELAHPRPAYPRTLAIAAALYSYWALAGMAVYGREAWTRYGEGFAVFFGLLSRIAPLAVRGGRVVRRIPLTGLAGPERVPGTLTFVAVMLGSTSFDGFSRTRQWQDLIGDVRADLVGEPQRVVDLATTAVNLAGLLAFCATVFLTYFAAVTWARRLVQAPRSLVPDFVLPLVPIALAYLVAHYWTYFVIQGQFAIVQISDPFGRGWDLLGTADYQPDLAPFTPRTVWYVQYAALVLGHVAGLAVAHDRAVALFRPRRDALLSQLPMLGLMVLYTFAGMWLLTRG